MTAHAETHAPEPAHTYEGIIDDPRIQAAVALKFEPSEVRDFDMADKAAGQMMGKLLAFLFCVLLFLMSGVNVWMITHKAKGTDPQAPVGAEADTGHDAEAGHRAEPAHH